MGETKENKQTNKSNNTLAQLLSGDVLNKKIITDNLGYIFFLLALSAAFVYKNHHIKEMNKSIANKQRELDQNTAEYVDAKTRFEFKTRRYRIAQNLKERNLIESQNAIKVIRVKKSADE
jgi:cell division protein FtsL